jgi:hypothetical protein
LLQRKQISILFGFTSLSEGMDAEDVTETMNRLWQIVDGVMAVWGMEIAAENDAVHALWAVLCMQAAVQGPCAPASGAQGAAQVDRGVDSLTALVFGEYHCLCPAAW